MTLLGDLLSSTGEEHSENDPHQTIVKLVVASESLILIWQKTWYQESKTTTANFKLQLHQNINKSSQENSDKETSKPPSSL